MSELLVKYDLDFPEDAYLKYAKAGDVGLDLAIKIAGSKLLPDMPHYVKPDGDEFDSEPWLEVPSCGYAEIETGVRVKLPEDSWAMITGRSSTAWKRRMMVATGIIDTGYTGYLRILVYNPNPEPKRLHEGDKIAQLIILPKYNLDKIIITDDLPDTERGQTGFGSSGS